MPYLRYNTSELRDLNVGSSEASKAYFGSTLVYQKIPTDGLVAWYGHKINGVDRITLSGGTEVSTWNDLITGGTNLTIHDTNYPVTYDKDKDALYFTSDGSGSCNLKRASAVVAGTGDRTYFTVTYRPDTASAAAEPIYWQDGHDAGTGIMRDYNSYRFFNGYTQFDEEVGSTVNEWLLRTDTPQTNYGSCTSRINGSAITKTGGSNGTNTWNVASDLFNLGTGLYQSGAWNGTRTVDFYCKELIAYNRVLTSSEIEEVETYLNNKYSIY